MNPVIKLQLEDEHRSRVLTDGLIRERIVEAGLISGETFSAECLNAASYDFRIGKRVVFNGENKPKDLSDGDTFDIKPGSYVGVVSAEKLGMPLNIIAVIGTKRKFS